MKITFSKITLFVVYLFTCSLIYCQDTTSNKKKVYSLKPAIDIPIIVGGAAWSAYASTYTYGKPPSSAEEILSLNSNNINPLDKWAITPYNQSIDKLSYYPFYAAFPLPFAFFLTGNDMRSDFFKLSLLYMETMAVTGIFGYSATYFENKYRPYVYSNGTSLAQKEDGNSKNSFYAGHVEIIATSTFFISAVYASYYPHSKVKWLFYSLSAAATAGMGYLRLEAGMHFPSDVLLGAGVGTLSGILVPYFHNHRLIKNPNLCIIPFTNTMAQGISMSYHFNTQPEHSF